MGRRKISFEPAARVFDLFGSIVIKVSLCGPHSFETSTLVPKVTEVVVPALPSAPLFKMNWYLSHQVGSCELFWADAVRGLCDVATKKRVEATTKRSNSR